MTSIRRYVGRAGQICINSARWGTCNERGAHVSANDQITPPSSPEATEDANETRGDVIVFSPDLFFAMRIRTALKLLRLRAVLANSPEDFVTRITRGDDAVLMGLIDMNQPVDWTAFSAAIGSDRPLVAFGPHTDVEGFKAAKQAGIDRVLSNGAFNSSFEQVVSRYAGLN